MRGAVKILLQAAHLVEYGTVEYGTLPVGFHLMQNSQHLAHVDPARASSAG